MKKKFLSFSMILLLILLISNCAKKTEKLRIGFIPFNADLPFFVAAEKGFFEQQELEIEPIRFGNSNLALNAMIGKKVIMVAGLTFSIFISAEQESPSRFKLFAPFSEIDDKIMSYLLVPVDSNISNLDDLRGKRIGTYAGATQLLYLKLFLKKIGFDPDKDVTIMQVASYLQVQSLSAKQFDALFTVEPYGTIAIEEGIARALLKNPRSQYIVNPFWSGAAAIDKSFWEQNPLTVKKIYTAIALAIDFINENEDEAKKILTKFTPMDENIALKSGLYKWYKIDDEIDFNSIQKIADFMFEYNLVERRIDVSQMFFSAEYLK